jgi:arylsulfatase A-like enzyme
LIIRSPDGARGKQVDDICEAIDLIPTFIEALGGTVPAHKLEGQSLQPYLCDIAQKPECKTAVFAELDYSHRRARQTLGLAVDETRAWMVFDGRWKYIHYKGFRPQLFDLDTDPQECCDIGGDADYQTEIDRLHGILFNWLSSRKINTTLKAQDIEARTDSWKAKGIIFGEW